MPTNYNIPAGGTVNWGGYLGIADPTATFGVFPSVLNQGGFQEMPTITEMHEIPSRTTGGNGGLEPNPNWGAVEITDDGWGTGRRRAGMLVSVLDGGSGTPKLFRLIPNGYFGNGGNLGVADWGNLTDVEKYELLDPIGLYNESGSPFAGWNVNTPTGAAGDCWVELDFGIDGNPITNVQYGVPSAGDLTITLTHDGTGSGAAITFTVALPTGYDGIYDPVVADATVVPTDVGGIDSGTTAGDLAGLSMNQMWDKLLFPTVYPTGGGASANLTSSYNLLEAQLDMTLNLSTTCGRGTLTNPSTFYGWQTGPWAGVINDAYITDISSGGATITQQNLTTSGNTNITSLSYNNYVVVLGENRFKLWVRFDQGVMPKDSTNADHPGVRYNLSNNPQTNTTDFEGVFPIYLGKADGTWEKRGLVSQNTNDIPCVQNYTETASLKHKIAVPQVMVQGGDITIELYHPTLGNNPSYPNGVGGAPSVWTKTAGTFTVHANAVDIDYWIYEKTASTAQGNTWIVNW